MDGEIRAADDRTRRILRAAADGDVPSLAAEDPSAVRGAVCSSGCTALHWAAGRSRLDAVRFLVSPPSLGGVGIDVDVPATRKSRGRTPLHYAARNGSLPAARLLVEEWGADPDARAKHGVTPFQLAAWQNHLPVCRWLVEESGVDAAQYNDFGCGAVHWIGLCPAARANFESESAGEDRGWDGADLLPLCRWLARQEGVDFRARQRQGHTALHKAAWGGHVALLRHLRDHHDLLDDTQDDAGNFAADLADMADTDRHAGVARFLREECSGARANSCRVLGVPVSAGTDEIRRVYLAKARSVHPDRLIACGQTQHGSSEGKDGKDLQQEYDFTAVRRAYEHLTFENGVGNQSNPAHSIHLMLELHSTLNSSGRELQEPTGEPRLCTDEHNLFKARLIAVLLEYGDKGLELCNIEKKWGQVWTGVPFPVFRKYSRRKKGALADFIQRNAGDVVDMVEPTSDTGSIVVVPKKLTRGHVSRTTSTVDADGKVAHSSEERAF